MIDPITALATATSVFKGIKVAVKIGKEAEEIFTQLGKWATAIEDVFLKKEKNLQYLKRLLIKNLLLLKPLMN